MFIFLRKTFDHMIYSLVSSQASAVQCFFFSAGLVKSGVTPFCHSKSLSHDELSNCNKHFALLKMYSNISGALLCTTYNVASCLLIDT